MNLLELRKQRKAHKPLFKREDGHKIMAIKGTGWRKPNGLHSKMRHQKRGQPALVEPGWGSPAAIRGTHASGLIPIVVNHESALANLTPKKHGVILSALLGMKNRIRLLDLCTTKGLRVLNIVKPAEYKQHALDNIAERKKNKKTKSTITPASPSTPAQKTEPNKNKESTLTEKTEEEQKAEEKKKLDKLLTQQQP